MILMMPHIDQSPRIGVDLSHVPDDATFLRDVDCRGCGYNLRGVRILGRCPECNHDNRESLVPNTLPYMDPDWLRRVHLGLRMVFVGLCLHCTPVLGIMVVLIGAFHPVAEGIATVALFTPVLGFVVAVIGGCVTTSANPAIDRVAKWRHIRVMARIFALVLLVAGLIFAILLLLYGSLPPMQVIWPLLVIGWIAMVGLVYTFSAWLYCLAQHTPDYPFDSAIGGFNCGRILSGSIALTGVFVIAGNSGWGMIAAPFIAVLVIVILLFLFFLAAEVTFLGKCTASAIMARQTPHFTRRWMSHP